VRSRLTPVAAGIALAILAATRPAPGQGVQYTGSLQFASGDYIFTERTSSVLLFNGLSADAGRLRVSASLPLIYQSTPWISYSTGVMIPSGGPEASDVSHRMGGSRMGNRDGGEVELADTTSVDELGLGDISLHAEVDLLAVAPGRPSLRVTGDAKVPVADVDRGFGTGEWDYGVGLSLSQPVGRTVLFASASYWILGDMADLELQDPVSYGVAVGYPLSTRVGLLLSISGYTGIIAETDPPAQLSLGLSYLIGLNRSLMGNAAFGLTESSPDISLSIGWRLGFD